MGLQQNSRRRLIHRRGRPMILSRATGVGTFVSVTVQGTDTLYAPHEIAGDIIQGDRMISILNDEIRAAGWPGPPRARDTISVDGQACAVQGGWPLYEGALCIGHNLHVRGGR